MVSLTDAYKQAGYRLSNPRNQWSARKEDGTGVALTVWRDRIDRSAAPMVFDTRDHGDASVWDGRMGNKMRIRDIEFCLERLGGRCDLILCLAKDPASEPRKVQDARHWYQCEGRICPESFDAETGHFRIEIHPAGS